ncbi:short-chain dehydrogenase [Mizugakiibacter sediminis]|uniref:3-oxoacyl-ACP reductase n=1 Tax=Mizugakiibacter sediminis TaxID=1475481 RepID=A0A0K8QQP8_9GAMM|nr:SDR family NAD(P)-dependent oxidoreductase [Mizugakiibacter sediminis]GAP67215.1 short-chain dehydrogenase [Mizugakiibacter sediminis]
MSQSTAIVTGAGGAIAASVIDAFEAAGWRLALIAYNDAERQRLERDRPRHLVVQADLADDAAAHAALAHVIGHFGAVDALLNIAGGFAMAAAAETAPSALEAQLDINLRTAFNATRAVLPHMLQRKRGFVLGVGAVAAIRGGAQVGAYAASKAALVAWLRSVRAEVSPQGVEVAIVYPMASVDTPANRAAMPDSDPSRWIGPDELAATILHLATRSGRGRIHEVEVYPPA